MLAKLKNKTKKTHNWDWLKPDGGLKIQVAGSGDRQKGALSPEAERSARSAASGACWDGAWIDTSASLTGARWLESEIPAGLPAGPGSLGTPSLSPARRF